MNEHEKLIPEAKRRARKRRGAGWLEEADMLDRLITALEAATSERDAALAAIERCRAVCLHLGGVDGDVSQPAPSYYVSVGRNVVATEVLAALDGAPEPEWEYAASKGDPGPHHLTVFSKDPETLAHRNEGRKNLGHEPLPIWRRRKAGPWLPVEGGEW